MEGFFDNVIASYSQAIAGGNNMAAVGVLGAAASLFDNVTNVPRNHNSIICKSNQCNLTLEKKGD